MERDVINCIECGATNSELATACIECGESLAAAYVQSHLDLAEASINNGEYNQASEHQLKADQIILTLSNEERERHLLTARAFWLQSIIHYGKGNMDRAKEELLDAQRSLDGKPLGMTLLADVLNRLGNIAYYEGNTESALSHYQQSSELAIKASANAIAAKAIGNMGNVYVGRGEIDVSASYYRRGLVYAEQAGSAALVHAYSTLTWLHSNYGPFSLALDYAAKAYALTSEVENLDIRTLSIIQIAAAHLKYGNLEQAEQYLLEAYALVERTGNGLTEEQVLAELAELLRQKVDHEAWQSYVIEAFRASANSPLLRKESALQLIIYYIKQDDLIQARQILDAMKTNHQENTPDAREAAVIRQAEGLLQAAEGNFQAAAQHFRDLLIKDTPADLSVLQVAQISYYISHFYTLPPGMRYRFQFAKLDRTSNSAWVYSQSCRSNVNGQIFIAVGAGWLLLWAAQFCIWLLNR